MIIVDLYWTWMRERIFYIKPLFNEETFKYINPDNYEEENKEKEKMIEKGKENKQNRKTKKGDFFTNFYFILINYRISSN